MVVLLFNSTEPDTLWQMVSAPKYFLFLFLHFLDTPSTESVKFPSQGKHKALPQIDPGWPGICSYSPNCHWAERSGLNMKTLKFTSGATLQVSTIPPGILDKVTRFYCCTTCGKVFWEGSHFRRVLSQFQEVLRITNDSSYLQM